MTTHPPMTTHDRLYTVSRFHDQNAFVLCFVFRPAYGLMWKIFQMRRKTMNDDNTKCDRTNQKQTAADAIKSSATQPKCRTKTHLKMCKWPSVRAYGQMEKSERASENE